MMKFKCLRIYVCIDHDLLKLKCIIISELEI